MNNKQIALIFVFIAWIMLAASTFLVAPVFIFYALICVGLSHKIYADQGKTKR